MGIERIGRHAVAEAPLQLEGDAMVNGVCVRLFVDITRGQSIGLAAGRRRVGQDGLIEVGSLGAVIRDGAHQRMSQILLHGKLPHLRVADAVIGVDGVGVGELILSRDIREVLVHGHILRQRGSRHIEGLGEWRLLRHIVGDIVVHGSVVIRAVAAAHHHGPLGEGPPRETDARGNVVLIRVDQRGRQRAGVGSGLSGLHLRHGGVSRRHIQIDHLVIQLRDGALVVPAEAEVDGELRV